MEPHLLYAMWPGAKYGPSIQQCTKTGTNKAICIEIHWKQGNLQLDMENNDKLWKPFQHSSYPYKNNCSVPRRLNSSSLTSSFVRLKGMVRQFKSVLRNATAKWMKLKEKWKQWEESVNVDLNRGNTNCDQLWQQTILEQNTSRTASL